MYAHMCTRPSAFMHMNAFVHMQVFTRAPVHHTNLDSGGVALETAHSAAAAVERGRGLGLRLMLGPERHADPQSLRHLLDERGAHIWQGLGHRADRQVKGQRQWL